MTPRGEVEGEDVLSLDESEAAINGSAKSHSALSIEGTKMGLELTEHVLDRVGLG